MKIVIFGASGATGQHLVQQALARSHKVTAFARRPESIISGPAPGLIVVQGDIHDGPAVAATIAGHDAVLSALGARNLGRSDVLEIGVRNILAGMAANGVNRIIVLGAAGVNADAAKHLLALTRVVFKLIISTLLKEPFRSQCAQERLLEGSPAQYTIVRPPRLTNRPGMGHYRVQEDGLPPGGTAIPRADVADFMIRQLTDTNWIRKGPYVAT
jgi:putative NADH-flavin reductase